MVTYDRLNTHGWDRSGHSLIALAGLERIGALKRSRGSITILDSNKLEKQCCECYLLFKSFNAELALDR